MRHVPGWVGAIVLAAAAAGAGPGAPGERIVAFRSDVTVRPDASLLVHERFTIRSEGGVERDTSRSLPIDANDRWDPDYVGEWKRDNGVRATVTQVLRHGEPIAIERGEGWDSNRLRLGGPLARGTDDYDVTYTVTGALTLAHDAGRADVLYWNALGHRWGFPVETASVAVHLPPGVPRDAVTASAYCGGRGVRGDRANGDLARVAGDAGAIEWVRHDLPGAAGLSVVVGWPAGYVRPPRFGIPPEEWGRLWLPAVLFAYYAVVWLFVGRDPRPGPVVPRYEPPDGMSPAEIRYVLTTGSDRKTVAAVLTQLAARGCLTIEPRDGEYVVTRRTAEAPPTLAPEEKAAFDRLFGGATVVALRPDQSDLLRAIQASLEDRLRNRYFTRNFGYVAAGALATAGAAWAMVERVQSTERILGLTFFFLMMSFAVGAILAVAVGPALADVVRGRLRLKNALSTVVPMGPVLAMPGLPAYLIARATTPVFGLVLVLAVLVNVVWACLLKAPTSLGRRRRDEIAGFRAFLAAVERDPLDRLNAPDAPLASKNALLPYAIALDLEQAWGDRLADALFGTTTAR